LNKRGNHQACCHSQPWRLREGKRLPKWHPLLTGDPESVANAGHSVRGRVIGPESGEDPLMNLIDWIK